ncbi:GyrI-like domain-containing protein [Pseudalkalibacillus hwajinpoensis]|uniref:GyrI-like domain-containing protein n=1 Tax=Guptibacillus hwajinpoensis TaxID=208199 RepID=UPI00325B310B
MSEDLVQQVTVEELGELQLGGIRVLCAGEQYVHEIPQAALLLEQRMSEIKHVIEPFIQVGAFVVEPTSREEDGYWVCVQVSEAEDLPEGIEAVTIPPQTYAVLKHKGANTEILHTYDILHKWIEESGYMRVKNDWHVERFHSWRKTSKIDVDLMETIIIIHFLVKRSALICLELGAFLYLLPTLENPVNGTSITSE